jgi:hypothetical protein
LSDIGILDTPVSLVMVLVVLGWPAMFEGLVVGGLAGWFLFRRHRFVAAAVGALAGLAIGTAGFVLWMG